MSIFGRLKRSIFGDSAETKPGLSAGKRLAAQQHQVTDADDGVVTDTRTGLMWMRCALGQTWDGTTCIGRAQAFSWGQAMALRHSFAGYDDWRLPSIDELKSIVDKPTDFPRSIGGSTYWSSSPDPSSSKRSPFSMREDGSECRDYPERAYRVRLVRGSQFLGAVKNNATTSTAQALPAFAQVEAHKDAPSNIIASPIREEVSGNFIVRSDGTVTDTRTGLMWMRCALGQTWDGTTCTGKPQDFTWDQTMALRHTFAGHDDWRLPDIDELKSISTISTSVTAIFPDRLAQPNVIFWTCSLDDNYSKSCMSFDFREGRAYRDYPERHFRVRLVRGGQSLGAVENNATTSPAQALPAFAQVEAHKDAPSNIIASPIREEVSGNFIVRSDGTVTDTRTGLMWMRCALGQTWDGTTCTGKPQDLTWDQAMALRHDFAGHDDWRLPNIDELKSIVDKTNMPPAIDTIAFPNASDSFFWSCSPGGNPNTSSRNYWSYSWYVYFSLGLAGCHDRGNSYGVRLVRGGQSFDTLNDGIIRKASSSPVEDVPASTQAEAHKDVPSNIIASPIREEASGDFVIRSDGTVTDTCTGLMWMRCALGQTWDGTTCTGKPQNFTWDQTMALRHTFAGHDDWRLPDIDELKSIVDKTRGGWCVESTSLSDTPNGRFWSSSPYDGYCAWFVVFGSGYVGNDLRNLPGFVRLVRVIQVLGAWDDADESHNVNISPPDERSVNIQAKAQMGAPGNIVGEAAAIKQADAEWPFSSRNALVNLRAKLEQADAEWPFSKATYSSASGASVSAGETNEFFTKPVSNCATAEFHIPRLSEWDGVAKRAPKGQSVTIAEAPDVEDDGGHNILGVDKLESTHRINKRLERALELAKLNHGSASIEDINPTHLSEWEGADKSGLNDLKHSVIQGSMITLSFRTLLLKLNWEWRPHNKYNRFALARLLESSDIGLEPDLDYVKPPKPDDMVVLFAQPLDDESPRTTSAYHAYQAARTLAWGERSKILESSHSTPAYQVALLTLQLSSAVAIADGDFCDVEKNHLREQIISWSHLSPKHQRRLLAHFELLKSAPASLANLKKKLGQLDVSAKESIAAFMTTVAQVDGVVLPAEVKILVYKPINYET